ncbi:MAG: hypothetical protein N3C61_00890, partial [Candidatus Micrarchaeota archaeon]|nr:hypothetical protein [Candidatus Micrarchaeota archaeon]
PDVYVIWPINSNSYTHGYRELIFLVVDDLADTITCNYNISGPVSYSNTTQINNLSIYSTLLLFNQGNYLLNITCNDSLNIRNTVITFNIRESGGSRDDESNEVPRGNQSTNNQTTNQTTNNQSQNVTLPNQNQTMNVSPQNNVSTQQNFTNNQNRQDNTNQNVSGNQTTQNIIPNQNNYPRPPPQQQPPQPTPTNNNSDTGTNQNTSPTQQTENSTQNQSSNQQNRAVSDNTGNVLGIIGILLLIVIIYMTLQKKISNHIDLETNHKHSFWRRISPYCIRSSLSYRSLLSNNLSSYRFKKDSTILLIIAFFISTYGSLCNVGNHYNQLISQ